MTLQLWSRALACIGVLAAVLSPTAASTSAYADGGSIGVRLLEASSNRADDPRALIYIVDHINPGTTITRHFEVANTTDQTLKLAVYPAAAEIKDEAFTPTADPNANELPEWITISQPELVANPHSENVLTATIAVPENAVKGERYGAIFAQVSSPKAGPTANVQLVNRVGIRVYLDIGPGGEPPSDFRIDSITPGRTNGGAPVVKAMVHNTGERALDVGGQLWLADGPGGTSAGPFRTQTGTTLAPGQSGPVLVTLDKRTPNGPWKATLKLESGRVEREASATLTFPDQSGVWGLPIKLSHAQWDLLLVGVIVLAITSTGSVYFIRTRRGRGTGPTEG